MLNVTAPYEVIWMTKVFYEMSTLILYLYAGYIFKPVNDQSGYAIVQTQIYSRG